MHRFGQSYCLCGGYFRSSRQAFSLGSWLIVGTRFAASVLGLSGASCSPYTFGRIGLGVVPIRSSRLPTRNGSGGLLSTQHGRQVLGGLPHSLQGIGRLTTASSARMRDKVQRSGVGACGAHAER